MKKTSQISVQVTLDENKIPEKLTWSAQDGGVEQESAKAVFLSVWDHAKKESLRIDLWTKDMPMDEMKLFFYQTFTAMSNTFERATGDHKMGETIRDFCDYFAEKLEIDRTH